jgi:hypothetical protein
MIKSSSELQLQRAIIVLAPPWHYGAAAAALGQPPAVTILKNSNQALPATVFKHALPVPIVLEKVQWPQNFQLPLNLFPR